jgi:hypothetical protein
MSNLKSLTFTAVAPLSNDPKVIRRQRLIERLEEQRTLAKDPSYAPMVRRWKKADDGSRVSVEQTRRLKPWWRKDANGNLILTVKSGLKTLEFEKGKTGIAVGSVERLETVFATLIAAVRAGELDAALAAATRPKERSGDKGNRAGG